MIVIIFQAHHGQGQVFFNSRKIWRSSDRDWLPKVWPWWWILCCLAGAWVGMMLHMMPQLTNENARVVRSMSIWIYMIYMFLAWGSTGHWGGQLRLGHKRALPPLQPNAICCICYTLSLKLVVNLRPNHMARDSPWTETDGLFIKGCSPWSC